LLAYLGTRLRASGIRVSARFGFMLAIGFLLIFLPTIALVMQLVTRTHSDVFSYLFFACCQTAGITCIVFAFRGRKKTEEDDLIISRKGSAKADEYERSATTTKI